MFLKANCWSLFIIVFFGVLLNSFIRSGASELISATDDNHTKNSINKSKYVDSRNECSLSDDLVVEIQSYQPIVDKLVATAVNGDFSGNTWKSLAEFTDKFGPRMTGTKNLDDAIDYIVNNMKAIGLDNVHTEDVTVPHWERGYEHAEMIAPRKQTIKITGLGSTIGTPRGGIIGNVVAVESFDEFKQLPLEKVRGNIVVFVPKYEGYGRTGRYRYQGASVASRKGAIASLVRSITPFSIGSLHTGQQNYESDVRKIPTAAITVEDAEMLLRMYRRGETITLHLEMEDRNLGNTVSRNTIGEFAGVSAQPVVVVSGHLDSWDLGVGAMDDGGGAFISWKALELLKRANVKKPRRTIRAILWTAEEQGIIGAEQYMNQHKENERNEFNFFFESDLGTFTPKGLDFSGNKEAECIFKEILKLMAPLNATAFDSPISSGPDIKLWVRRGFPGAALLNQNENYFWYHHSDGDSMLVENSDDLDKNTALFAAAAYVIADLSIDMPKEVLNAF